MTRLFAAILASAALLDWRAVQCANCAVAVGQLGRSHVATARWTSQDDACRLSSRALTTVDARRAAFGWSRFTRRHAQSSWHVCSSTGILRSRWDVSRRCTDPEEPPLPKGAKPGVFQQILVTETYLPRLGGDQGFGMNDTLVQLTLGFPFFTRANPLVVMPAFEIQMLDGPTSPSLPPQLYDASIDFLNIRKLTDRFSLLIGASPGTHTATLTNRMTRRFACRRDCWACGIGVRKRNSCLACCI